MANPNPQPEHCGHCGNDAEMQSQDLLCFFCGKRSHFDGSPINGNSHFRMNYSGTLPEANGHGIDEFRKD